MQKFTRKNILVLSGTFTASDNSGATPSNAEAILSFLDGAGTPQSATFPLTLSGGNWTGEWDSSAAAGGRVDWMAHCWGGLVAAQEGTIELCANAANKS